MNPYIHIALIIWTLLLGFILGAAAIASRHNLPLWAVVLLQIPFILSLFTALLGIGQYIK